ncbi:phage holin family protein [Aneurinibacillus terranovensis]|uniref:phage holin family protein n=1 Tax=Aneurinibacillus terranovensis TaxID=278991 RepID=UPI0004024FDC|nr:phage holin family protein [Aneurinibacillus terranovensis]
MEKETIFKWITGGIGAVLTYFFGGWPPLLDVLVYMIVIDYVTGFYAAWIEKRLSSSTGFRGIGKKFLILTVVTVAHKLDIALNSPGLLRNTAIWFYIANEGLSLAENIARAGLPFPAALKNALIQIKNRAEDETKPKRKRGA